MAQLHLYHSFIYYRMKYQCVGRYQEKNTCKLTKVLVGNSFGRAKSESAGQAGVDELVR